MEMISKKELLRLTGISYGQLYRWKRETLIPEEWFVKQASFTGQETFFPREQMLNRVQAIMKLKDQHSLDELAALFSPDADIRIAAETMQTGVPDGTRLSGLLVTSLGRTDFSVGEIALARGLDRLAESGKLPSAALPDLIRTSVTALSGQRLVDTTCSVLKAGDGWHVCFCRGTHPPVFDSGLQIHGLFSIEEMASDLRRETSNETGISTKGERNA